jgi:DNA-binding HxlR family transcriptional regulator
MRSYGQFCALAKALDVIGDRWSLLIVRELMLRDACRYTDLREGLPGIATNLLATRLRELEHAGVIKREEAPPPVATTLYRLTERGMELRAVTHALGRWGAPLLAEAPEDDAFCAHWLALPLGLVLGDRARELPAMTIVVHDDERPVVIEIADGEVHARPGQADQPDAVITATRWLTFALLIGTLPLAEAEAQGLEFEGDPGVIERLQREAGAAAAGH